MPPDERSHLGMFLAFQYPSEIPGVRSFQMLKSSLDAKKEYYKEKKLSVREFSKLYDQKVKDLEFFDKAVTNLLPPPLVQIMGVFGGEVKEDALKLMEEK
mgnify:CR=1 FL=1